MTVLIGKVVGRVTLFAALALIGVPESQAENFTLSDVWSDTTAYFTSPLNWDRTGWERFGATVAAAAVAHEFDGKVRNHFAGQSPTLDGKDKNSTRDAAPAAAIVAGTLVMGWALDEKAGRIEAYRMVEAAALGSATAEVLKLAAGRSRPNETLRVDDWRTGGNSFPSLHTTAAFAIGTVFAESGSDEYRWLRRFVGYGMASATAYARLHGNQHWLSDVVAGSAIGVYAGAFTVNRRLAGHSPFTFNITPTDAGGLALQLTYTPP